MEPEKNIVITGGNRGIGFYLADRLLQRYPLARICLACRSRAKAESAVQSLRKRHPRALLEVVLLDTASLRSVFAAASELRERFDHIDFLYCNAGIMPVEGLNWRSILQMIVSLDFGNFAKTMSTGHGILIQTDGMTEDGLREVFATNLFGHFILLRELECILGGNSTSRVLWTSSCNARRSAFNMSDIQHCSGHEAYSSSKFATDLVIKALNDRYLQKNIRVYTTSPGLVLTQLTEGLLPSFVWYIIIPFFLILRLLVSNITLSPQNATEGLMYLSGNALPSPGCKYLTHTSFFGRNFVQVAPIDGSFDESQQLLHKLDDMYEDHKRRHNYAQ